MRGFSIDRLLPSLVAAIAASCVCGCGQVRDQVAAMPSVDPTAAAEQAIEQYDHNHNGSLDEIELAGSPGIFAVRDRYDADGNREISEAEIASRLTAIYAGGTPWVSADCLVLQGGRPLAGAAVHLVPEPFLQDAIQPAIGTTDARGHTTPAAADEKLPENMRGLQIIQPGIYRVDIKHPSIKLPAKSLGCEIDPVSRGGTTPVFKL